jgi:prephenate dehydratase
MLMNEDTHYYTYKSLFHMNAFSNKIELVLYHSLPKCIEHHLTILCDACDVSTCPVENSLFL